MTIFRIVQEALTNVARHAGATECEVCVESRGGMLEVRVTDNGRGGELAALSGARSLGIIGMKERAAALGGMVRVENGQKGGVRVTARIPWSPAPDGE
jgi:signal transduction histidine kinase